MGTPRTSSRGEIPCRTVNRNSSAGGWTGGGVEGTLLGAKLGLTFINICMNDLAETINSTLMRSPARQAGSKGQILSSAAEPIKLVDPAVRPASLTLLAASEQPLLGTTAASTLMPGGHCSPRAHLAK